MVPLYLYDIVHWQYDIMYMQCRTLMLWEQSPHCMIAVLTSDYRMHKCSTLDTCIDLNDNHDIQMNAEVKVQRL